MRERIWRSQTQSYLRVLPGQLGVSPRGRSRRLDRVLTDFGCEHSFARAAESVREHYGFEIGASAVRTARLHHARRAQEQLQQQYERSYRALPATSLISLHWRGRLPFRGPASTVQIIVPSASSILESVTLELLCKAIPSIAVSNPAEPLSMKIALEAGAPLLRSHVPQAANLLLRPARR